MPGTPPPVGMGPNGLPVFWNAVVGAIQQQQQATNGLTSGAQQTILVDQWGNGQVVIGQLNQTLTIGAAYQQAGVQVGTVLPASGQPNVGIAWQQNLATGTITLTQGSTSATLASTISGTFTNGKVIGAATVADPSTGAVTSAITPGTTLTISGTAITLSQPAAESGTGLYCAACYWRSLPTPAGWTAPTLLNSWANTGSGFDTAGYLKDALGFVHLKGLISGGTSGTNAFILPAGYRPDATVFAAAPTGSLGGGAIKVFANGNVEIDYSGASTSVGLSSVTFLAEN